MISTIILEEKNNLGVMYASDEGVTWDYAGAMKWNHKEAA
jgi:hypothetical protein